MSNLNNKIGFMLCEQVSEAEEVKIIGEANNRLKIEANMQEAEELNRNSRIYPKKDLLSEINCKRTKELVESGNMFGEAGHPMSKDISRQSTVDPTNIAHKISKIWMDGNVVKAHTEGTQNSLGESFNSLIMTGTKPSFSLRALGSVSNTPRGAVVQNIKLITYDWVIYPSHPKAYMTGLVQEATNYAKTFNPNSVNYDKNNKFIMEENDKGIMIPITNEKVINYIKSESSNIKTMMESFDTLYNSISLVENGRYVQLIDESGNVFMINLERYIQNEVMNYCYKNY